MKSVSSTKTVYDELYSRLVKIFKNGMPVFFSFSGGKDSLVIAKALEELIQQKRIDPKLLHVLFVDEEAIFPCVERIVHYWRKRYLMLGASFYWMCLEVRHFNCFNQLSSDESFICWDHTKKDVWIRQPPSFAMTTHPLLRPGDSYQEFIQRFTNCIQLVGVRAGESVQRQSYMTQNGCVTKKGSQYYLYPIYDWSLNDVWLFLYQKKVEIPDAYQYMWKTGRSINQLRISQFFSIDTAVSLVSLVEFYPGLYEKILRREPNAYLAMYYFDTEMFRRHTQKRKKLEGDQAIDWKAKFYEAFFSPENKVKKEHHQLSVLISKNSLILENCSFGDKLYRRMYDMLVAGDPKQRTLRAIYTEMAQMYQKESGLDRK